MHKNSDKNKMPADNLAGIFMATLCNPDPDDDEVKKRVKQKKFPEHQLTQELIEHPEYVPIL